MNWEEMKDYLEMENWLWGDYVHRITNWKKQVERFNAPIKVQFT